MTPRLINGAGELSPIVDHEVLDPLELAHLDGSPTTSATSQTGHSRHFEDLAADIRLRCNICRNGQERHLAPQKNGKTFLAGHHK